MIYFIGINIVAFLLMGIDKYKAIHNLYRIPENSLLAVAIVGGVFGEMAGMYFFHHKTLHKKFSIGLPLIACFYIFGLFGY